MTIDDSGPAPPGRDRAARLRDAGRRAAAPRRPLRRAAGAAAVGDGRAGLRPPRRVGRPGAQRQPRLPQRLRPPLRGGAAGRRPDRRPGRARGQRVRGHGGRGAPAHAASSCSRTSACRASPATSRPRCDRSCSTRASARAGGSGSWVGRPSPSRETIELPSFLVDELRHAVGAERAGGERDGPPDRPRHRAAGGQRAGPARRVRVGRVPDLLRRAARAHRSGPRA